MADQLDLFSPSSTPILWRRPAAATFIIIESKEPTGFEVRCVTAEGKHANSTPTYVAGELVADSGYFYQALRWTGRGVVKSPLYNSIEEAKGACETCGHLGAFPELEKGNTVLFLCSEQEGEGSLTLQNRNSVSSVDPPSGEGVTIDCCFMPTSVLIPLLVVFIAVTLRRRRESQP